MKKELNISAYNKNDEIAALNRKFFYDHGIFALNIIGSPGCGKTSVLEYTAKNFPEKFAILIGDVKTALDSDRILQSGHHNSHGIETGGGCHLSAAMIRDHLSRVNTGDIDYLFIENVGNLVCPSSFDLGENLKVAMLSIPEGDEKVKKYPNLFIKAGAVIINKVDLKGIMEYNLEQVKRDCLAHNPEVRIFETSVKTGKGFGEWFQYLTEIRKSI